MALLVPSHSAWSAENPLHAPHAYTAGLHRMPARHAYTACVHRMPAPHACTACLHRPHACTACLPDSYTMLAPHACVMPAASGEPDWHMHSACLT